MYFTSKQFPVMIPQIHIEDYNYSLPYDRIAKYPLEQRDFSKLLIYDDDGPRTGNFRDISSYLPEGALMVFNDTKVVPARLHFRRQTGAPTGIVCLEAGAPVE